MSFTQGNSSQKILIVEPLSSGAEYLNILSNTENCEITSVYMDSFTLPIASKTKTGNIKILNFNKDLDSSITKLAAHCIFNDIKYVLAGCEPAVKIVEEVRKLIPTPYTNDVTLSSARYDKGAMQSALAHNNVPHLSFHYGTKVSDFLDFLDNYNFSEKKLMIKPSVGGGSVGVSMVSNENQALKEISNLLNYSDNLYGEKVESVTVQEYFEGTEYVVDTFSLNGIHHLSTVCVYTKKLDSTGKHFIYLNNKIISEEHPLVEPLFTYVQEILSAVGIQNGISHTELMVNKDEEIRLIELNFRAHGGNNPTFIKQLTGSSHLHQELDFLTKGKTPPSSYKLHKSGRFVFFALDKPRTTKNINNFWAKFSKIKNIAAGSELNLQANTEYTASKDLSDQSQFGCIRIAGDSETELDQVEIDLREIFMSCFL